MNCTGRTRRHRTQRLDVTDAAGNVHQLTVWITEHEREKDDGFCDWLKRGVDYQLSNGRRARSLNFDTFEDLEDGTRYVAVR